jgi:proteasome accessory factor B
LSRVGPDVSTVGPRGAVRKPEGVDLREIVNQAVAEWPPGSQARVWVADGRATALRRQSAVMASRTLAGRAGDEIAIDIGRQDRLAREIAGYGADAVVLEPQSLRDDVVARLRAHAEGVRA